MGQTESFEGKAPAMEIHMPEDLLIHIFSFGQPSDLARWSRVCISWHNACSAELTWRNAVEGELGLSLATYKKENSIATWREVWQRFMLKPPANFLKANVQFFTKPDSSKSSMSGRVMVCGGWKSGKSTLVNICEQCITPTGITDLPPQKEKSAEMFFNFGGHVVVSEAAVKGADTENFNLQITDWMGGGFRTVVRNINHSFMRQKCGVLLCVSKDAGDGQWKEQIDMYLDQIDQAIGRNALISSSASSGTSEGPMTTRPPIALVVTKCDLPDTPDVPSKPEMEAYAKSLGLPVYYTNNKDGGEAMQALQALVHKMATTGYLFGSPKPDKYTTPATAEAAAATPSSGRSWKNLWWQSSSKKERPHQPILKLT